MYARALVLASVACGQATVPDARLVRDAPVSVEVQDTSIADPPVWEPPPHVVVILVDDVGWTGLSGGRTSLGYASDLHQTPRIDALAEDGVAYSAAYASPMCIPGRAALLTGQHPAKTGVYANFNTHIILPELRLLDPARTVERLPLEVDTIAERLAPLGYRSGNFGKWHLGKHGVDGPVEQGFEINVGGTDDGRITGGRTGHFATHDGAFDGLPGLGPNGVSYQFAADRITDEALAWLGADLDTPSFALISHFSAHEPIQSPLDDSALFEDLAPGSSHDDPIYAGMLHNLDRNVGRVVDWLEATPDPRRDGRPLVENTLLVLISDNGGQGGYEPEGVFVDSDRTHQAPLRLGKGSAREGGVRVPMIVRWDRGLGGGRVVDEPVQHLDVAPTILELAGGWPMIEGVFDGQSLVRTLGPIGAPMPRDAVFLHYPAYHHFDETVTDRLLEEPVSVVWDDRYKLSWRYQSQVWELFDLDHDLGETTNLAADQPWRVADLGQRLVDWLVATDAALPTDRDTGDPVPLPDPYVL